VRVNLHPRGLLFWFGQILWMIVIVASRYDAPARRLKERWAGSGARLFTCEDLSVSGWRSRVTDPAHSTAVIGGLQVKQSEIRGVFTRLQWVWEGELVDIAAGDRAYVAAEMAAFLVFWLSGLTCPMLNRPTANSLSGPGWGRERWNFAASKAGMLVSPIRRFASLASASSRDVEVQNKPVLATVVGGQCIGEVHPALAEQTRRLADIAGLDFLGVQFSSAEADASFVGVNLFPDIEDGRVADAALNYFA
jgi:hypothetical protein